MFERPHHRRIATLLASLDVEFLCASTDGYRREDLFAEKLLANADRSADRAMYSRDAIDLGMMIAAWGPPPGAALAAMHMTESQGRTVLSALRSI